jgi:hypothetical protein
VTLFVGAVSAEPSRPGVYVISYVGDKNPPKLRINNKVVTNLADAILTFQVGDRLTIRALTIATPKGRTRKVTGRIKYFKELESGGLFGDDIIHYNREPKEQEDSVTTKAHTDFGPTLTISPRGKNPIRFSLFDVGGTNKDVTLDQLTKTGYTFTPSRSGTLGFMTKTDFQVRTGTFWRAPPLSEADIQWCKGISSHWCDGKRNDEHDVDCETYDVKCTVETGIVDITLQVTLERPN